MLAALLAATLAACAIPVDRGGGAAPPEQPVQSQLPRRGDPAMAEDERLAVQAVDTFWRNRFGQLFNGQYTSPRIAGPYVGRTGPPCAGEPSIPFNAVYCPSGDFVAWDEKLMGSGFKAIGDAWIYLIIAHEWGHAIQSRIDGSLVSVAAELQADCLAGATLQGATEDRVIRLEPGDTQELSRTLQAVADEFPWTNTADHGDATQRITSFNRGARGGVRACV